MTDKRIEQALQQAVDLGEIGVQVAAWHGTELVVDAWIGTADEVSERKVDGDTLFPVFSVSKAFVATAVHLLAERGLLDINSPVARYWPEYAENGKDVITSARYCSTGPAYPRCPTTSLPKVWPTGTASCPGSPERLRWRRPGSGPSTTR